MKNLFTYLLTLITITSYAQTGAGKISGKILSAGNQPIANVSIKVQENNQRTRADVDGRFSISIPAGTYSLLISATGYESRIINEVEVKKGETTPLDVILEVQVNQLGNITVKAASAKKETVNTAIAFQKNTNTVAQVISAEAIKRSPDKNTSEVLKRVSGASIQEGKYIIVRGLADRYNQATLNGALLSSSEPDRKTFAFDIFPSSILDNIIVNKAAVPELPGEFSGGLVQLNTKDAVDKNFLTATVGGGFNTQVVSNPFYTYQGGKTDYLGVDDGYRKLPAGLPATETQFNGASSDKLASYGTQFKNNWNYFKRGGLFNKSLQLTGGRVLLANGVSKLSVLASASYNEQFRSYNKLNRFTEGDGSVRFDYNDNVSADNILVGAIANVAFQSRRFKLSWKNSYNITSTDQYTIRNGIDNGNQLNVNAMAFQSSFKSNQLLNSQLAGEHVFSFFKYPGGTRLKWNANVSVLNQKLPDLKNLSYNETENNGVKTYTALINPSAVLANNVGRFFSDLKDKIYGINGDLSQNFNLYGVQQVVKIGGMYQRKNRDFNSRIFGVKIGQEDNALLALPVGQIFSAENFSADKLYMYELTTASNSYDAFVNLWAGYLQFDNKVADDLKITWGGRVEGFSQEVSFLTTMGRTRYRKNYTDFLPSININYSANKITNIRIGASRTVSRPEFREVAPFSFFDFEKNGTIYGQTNLERAVITNLDARYELYPRAGEMITFGVFYKHFDKPIESSYGFASGSPIFSYVNAKSADTYGVELEFRKKLDFAGVKVINDMTAFANIAAIHSQVNFDASVVDQVNRPMQGQSPFVINAGLQYSHDASRTNASILFNRIGRRISQVGFAGFGNIYEAPRSVVDFQLTKGIFKAWELKLTISDLLNQKANFYQDNDENKKYNSDKDNLFNSLQYGINFGLNVTYTF